LWCGHHYHVSKVLRISLPQSTYGLDVLAFIGNPFCNETDYSDRLQEIIFELKCLMSPIWPNLDLTQIQALDRSNIPQ
jgi:hypothetical protein